MSLGTMLTARREAITSGQICPACQSNKMRDEDRFKCGSMYKNEAGRKVLVATLLCVERAGNIRYD